MPTRRIVLTTEVNGSRTGHQSQTRVYGATIQDRNGAIVDHDSAVIASGAKFASNTRLQPSERRMEDFTFKIDPDENIEVRSTLTYRYEPLGGGQAGIEIDFSEKRKESIVDYTKKSN
jgi:hypothetical protein